MKTMEMNDLIEKEVKTEIEDCLGNIFEVSFTRRTYSEFDPSYGYDADGRRGEPRVMIIEDTAADLCVKILDSYVPIQEINHEIRTSIEEVVYQWLVDNPVDF